MKPSKRKPSVEVKPVSPVSVTHAERHVLATERVVELIRELAKLLRGLVDPAGKIDASWTAACTADNWQSGVSDGKDIAADRLSENSLPTIACLTNQLQGEGTK